MLREGAEELAAGLEDEEADEAAGALVDERTDEAEDDRAEVAEGAAELTELDEPPMLMFAERSRGEEFFPYSLLIAARTLAAVAPFCSSG